MAFRATDIPTAHAREAVEMRHGHTVDIDKKLFGDGTTIAGNFIGYYGNRDPQLDFTAELTAGNRWFFSNYSPMNPQGLSSYRTWQGTAWSGWITNDYTPTVYDWFYKWNGAEWEMWFFDALNIWVHAPLPTVEDGWIAETDREITTLDERVTGLEALNLQATTHEEKSKSLDSDYMTGVVNWIVIKLNDNISLISFYGNVNVITAHATDFVILSVEDEPLFSRFLGRVDKIAWEEEDTAGISGLHYHYDSNGITFDSVTDSQVLNKQMNFAEMLAFVTT